MRIRNTVAAVGIGLLFASLAGFAAEVKVVVTGIIADDPSFGPPVGDAVLGNIATFTFTYEDTTPDSYSSPDYALYNHAIKHVRVEYGTRVFDYSPGTDDSSECAQSCIEILKDIWDGSGYVSGYDFNAFLSVPLGGTRYNVHCNLVPRFSAQQFLGISLSISPLTIVDPSLLIGDISTVLGVRGCLFYEDSTVSPTGSTNGFWATFQSIRVEIPLSPNQVTTPVGSGVAVDPVVTLPDGTSSTMVQMQFQSVQTAGTTSVTASTTPSGGATEPPTGFQVGVLPIYYDVSTTATFTGTVGLCFSWTDGEFFDESSVKLFHYENGGWRDVTTSLNTTSNVVCGNVTTLSPFAVVEKSYSFSGFFQPVDNRPTRNIAKAGSAIPIKFSLSGNQGLAVIYPGYPVSQSLTCDSSTPSDAITETVSPGATLLSYDPSSDRYTYIWKTDKSWAQSCRRLFVKLSDGSLHTADFGFSK